MSRSLCVSRESIRNKGRPPGRKPCQDQPAVNKNRKIIYTIACLGPYFRHEGERCSLRRVSLMWPCGLWKAESITDIDRKPVSLGPGFSEQ